MMLVFQDLVWIGRLGQVGSDLAGKASQRLAKHWSGRWGQLGCGVDGYAKERTGGVSSGRAERVWYGMGGQVSTGGLRTGMADEEW